MACGAPTAIQVRPDWNRSSRTNAGHTPPLPSVISLAIVPAHSWRAVWTEAWLGARQTIAIQFSIRGLAATEAVAANEVRWFGRDGCARTPTRQGSARGSTLGSDHGRHAQHQVVARERILLSQSRVPHVLEAVLDARYARCRASRCSRVARQSARPLGRYAVGGSRSRPSFLHRSPGGAPAPGSSHRGSPRREPASRVCPRPKSGGSPRGKPSQIRSRAVGCFSLPASANMRPSPVMPRTVSPGMSGASCQDVRAGWQMIRDSVQNLPSALSLRPVKPRFWDGPRTPRAEASSVPAGAAARRTGSRHRRLLGRHFAKASFPVARSPCDQPCETGKGQARLLGWTRILATFCRWSVGETEAPKRSGRIRLRIRPLVIGTTLLPACSYGLRSAPNEPRISLLKPPVSAGIDQVPSTPIGPSVLSPMNPPAIAVPAAVKAASWTLVSV